jgi:ABC-type Zn2+ transport system substrate-binding protein/surface adhesin
MARYVLRLERLASLTEDEVVSWIGPTLQRYLTGRALDVANQPRARAVAGEA